MSWVRAPPAAPYRRHSSDCNKGHDRDLRILRPRNQAEKARDCTCVIHAAGRLTHESKRVLHKPVPAFDPILKREIPTNDWDRAEATAKQWLEWGQTTRPASNALLVNPTIQQAWDRFYEKRVMKGKQATVRKYNNFYEYRLKAWCDSRGGTSAVAYSVFDVFELLEDFVESWRNANPHRNRKTDSNAEKKPGGWVPAVVEDVRLGGGSHNKELERFSAFLNYGAKHDWIKENLTGELPKADADIQPKYGLTFLEVERVLDVIEAYPDCYGRIEENRLQQRRIRAFIFLLRYSGIRIGDAAMFNSKWVLENPQGDGYVIHVPKVQKNQKPVTIPMDDGLAEALFSLPYKCEKGGVGYWFWTGEGQPDTATGVWQDLLGRLYDLAQDPNPSFDRNLPLSQANKRYLRPFEHHTTPHTWRHTFAILSLIGGAKLEDVSRWLGHSSPEITIKHYGHANSSMIANDVDNMRAIRKAQQAKVEQLKNDNQQKLVRFPVGRVS